VLATATFAVTWVLQRPGYVDSEIPVAALIAGCAALGLLTLGGTLGGALAYVYGVRVVKRDVPLADALIPGRLEESPAPARSVYAPPAGVTPAAPAPVAANGGSGESMAEYERRITARGGS
jgi:hypothetical protein